MDAKLCNLNEGQRFKFPNESIIRTVRQKGRTEMYCPKDGQNTIGHSKSGGEEVFLQTGQKVTLVCSCEMPAKIKGENKCWRCKNYLN